MTRADPSLEKRVADLERQVTELREALKAHDTTARLPAETAPRREKVLPQTAQGSEEILSWVDKSYILPRVATTSFIIVVALALRTAADSEALDRQLGSFLGMLYAFGLIVYGWFAYRRDDMQAPVFTLWGAFLMSAVVVEAHRVFDTVPAEMAYLTLLATGAVTTVMSRMNRVALPVFAGTLGMSFGAFAIGYPSPHFPYLAMALILANAFAAIATRLLRASWLRWLLLLLTLFMVQIWSLKLAIYLGKLTPDLLDPTIRGFFAATSILAVTYAVLAFLGVRGIIQEKVSKFDILLPILTVLWFAPAGLYVTRLGLADPALFGWLGSVGGIGLVLAGLWLATRQTGGALGATPFSIAGGLLLILTAPAALGHTLPAYALTALLALGLARISSRQSSVGLRLSSYLLQLLSCLALVLTLSSSELVSPSLLGALSSALLAAIAFVHYAWAKSHPPAVSDESLADRINKQDRWGSSLLIAALLSSFYACRVGLYQLLDLLHLARPAYFSGAQSVMINLTAAILFALGLLRRDKELRNVAIIVTLIGGAKVFILDMMALKGVPLLLGVFSFGMVAALASFVIGRWQKEGPAESDQAPAG
ncbi:MAG: hypothetical protein RQ723_10870 [Desulfuromonadales bacterium]|nr:hypothetical protein [Desulfuromonadales bacterium]